MKQGGAAITEDAVNTVMPTVIPTLYNQILSTMAPLMGSGTSGKPDNNVPPGLQKGMIAMPQTQHLLQPPPPQVLVIERMHSGKHVKLQSGLFH